MSGSESEERECLPAQPLANSTQQPLHKEGQRWDRLHGPKTTYLEVSPEPCSKPLPLGTPYKARNKLLSFYSSKPLAEMDLRRLRIRKSWMVMEPFESHKPLRTSASSRNSRFCLHSHLICSIPDVNNWWGVDPCSPGWDWMRSSCWRLPEIAPKPGTPW